MKITLENLSDRSPEMIAALVRLWERSVRATHDFLAEEDIQKLKPLVEQGVRRISRLVAALDDQKDVCGFMGVEKNTIEMLFIAPEQRGNGLGRRFINYGVEILGVSSVDVNEQNPQAAGFYAHMGFIVYKRSAEDKQGNPFPILHMRLPGAS